MDWIKRNLMFVIGAVVALVLLGAAGWYSWSGWSENAAQREEIDKQYEELKRLTQLKPSPGDGRKVNNIKLAQEQEKEAREFMGKFAARLQRIPALPPGTNLTASEYSAALQRTIVELQRDATNHSVVLPPKYKFSFEAQAGRVTFAPGSLEPLAAQLGEVKVIAGILNEAKINALDSIRRLRVSEDDRSGPATDYLELPGLTNELAVSVPYEVTIRCFTPELASVLTGFANSDYGLIVKGVNLEVSPMGPVGEMPGELTAVPMEIRAAVPVNPEASRYGSSVQDMYRRRYGIGGGGKRGEGATQQPQLGGGYTPIGNVPPTPVPAPYGVPAAAPVKTGIQPFLSEKQLKVTILVHVVKLLPQT